jgi:hypothetical protein
MFLAALRHRLARRLNDDLTPSMRAHYDKVGRGARRGHPHDVRWRGRAELLQRMQPWMGRHSSVLSMAEAKADGDGIGAGSTWHLSKAAEGGEQAGGGLGRARSSGVVLDHVARRAVCKLLDER